MSCILVATKDHNVHDGHANDTWAEKLDRLAEKKPLNA